MRKISLLVAVALSLVVSPFVRAEETLSETQIDIIRTNCVNAQVSLQRIQETERVARINRGYLYESTLRLMTSFNGRVALNNINVPDMIATTGDFQETLSTFRANYTTYDEAMDKLVKIDCRNKPVQYNNYLVDARVKRSELNKRVIEFDAQLDKYQYSVNWIKKTLEAQK